MCATKSEWLEGLGEPVWRDAKRFKPNPKQRRAVNEVAVKSIGMDMKLHGQRDPVVAFEIEGDPDFDAELVAGTTRHLGAVMYDLPILTYILKPDDPRIELIRDTENVLRSEFEPAGLMIAACSFRDNFDGAKSDNNQPLGAALMFGRAIGKTKQRISQVLDIGDAFKKKMGKDAEAVLLKIDATPTLNKFSIIGELAKDKDWSKEDILAEIEAAQETEGYKFTSRKAKATDKRTRSNKKPSEDKGGKEFSGSIEETEFCEVVFVENEGQKASLLEFEKTWRTLAGTVAQAFLDRQDLHFGSREGPEPEVRVREKAPAELTVAAE